MSVGRLVSSLILLDSIVAASSFTPHHLKRWEFENAELHNNLNDFVRRYSAERKPPSDSISEGVSVVFLCEVTATGNLRINYTSHVHPPVYNN